MSRRARSRRDKRAPIPDFDDPQPRHLAGLSFLEPPMNATTQLLTTLRSGACLKLGGRSHRFFLLKNSTQLPADQAAARKLASDGTLRPHGIDSHGNYVFALSAKGQKQ